MLISVGWLPPYWCPSRRLLRSRLEGRGLVTRSKIAPKTGAASPPMARDRDQRWFAPSPGWAAGLRRHRDRSGDCPSERDRKSTRLNSSHGYISYAVFCLKKKKKKRT